MAYMSLTFDDGFLNHYGIARTLYKLDVSASFYIPTGRTYFHNGPAGRLVDRPDLIREMVDMGHEIGSHTYTHRDLTKLTSAEVERECAESKLALSGIIGSKSEVIGLAYPYGLFNEITIEEVRRYYS